MRILVIPSWFPTELRPGGECVVEHTKAAALGHEIVVLCPYVNPIRTFMPPHYPLREIDKWPQFPVIRFRIPRIRLVWPLIYLTVTVVEFLRLRRTFKPDLIHAHIGMPAGFAAAMLNMLFGIPFVITEQTGPFHILFRNKFELALLRWAMERAEAIVPASDYLRRQIEHYGIKNRFFIVPNTVDTTIFSPGEKRPPGSTIKILFVGGLTPIKNVSMLIKALAQLRKTDNTPFVLDVVGDGEYRFQYEALVKKLGMSDVVQLHGWRTKAEVAEFMRRCDFLVLPSKSETFPSVLVEAMACGKPVLATGVGGPPEIVNERTGMLVFPDGPDRLAAAIRAMIKRLGLFRQAEIAEYAKRRFSLPAVSSLLNDIYIHVTS